MKKLLILCCTLFISTTAFATNCETVKEQIAEKIKANGVAEFTLDAVDKGTATDGKVVGVCGGGTKDVVYKRGHVQTTEQTYDNAVIEEDDDQSTDE
ncbi:DUF1161 domain-containing protein [Entomomonas asaccharolytica]|uniref:DUF1161 domain-containing protein n=1 Tax=Entomomonas asaccharolytica TaxID=2785331 RepID=A0A974NF15_9GAMM|nr:DUF1161 domain-containing protein [Entomomonas asaccharolytica]